MLVLIKLISTPLCELRLIPNVLAVILTEAKAFLISLFWLKKYLSGFFKNSLLKFIFKGSGKIGIIV